MPRVSRWSDEFGTPVRIHGKGRNRDYVYALAVAGAILAGRRRFDAVYFLMPGLQVLLGSIAARVAGVPFVMKFSGSNEVIKLTYSAVGRLELRLLRKWCRRIMVLNPGMIGEARSAGFDGSSLSWMPNPVDIEEYAPATQEIRDRLRQELGIPQDSVAILFCGRLAPEKELPTLLLAFASIAGRIPRARLIVVGDGAMRPELEAQTARDGLLDRVVFAGMAAPSTIPKWLKASDIFALVSSLEGLPVSLLEAMATGLAVVGSGIPAIQQIVRDGENGLIAEVGNASSIAEALSQLATDAELRSRLGATARGSVAAQFSTESVIAHYEKLFDEIIG